MKLSEIRIGMGKADYFLTHTVQMKHMIYYDVFDREKLLNPHGSDETI